MSRLGLFLITLTSVIVHKAEDLPQPYSISTRPWYHFPDSIDIVGSLKCGERTPQKIIEHNFFEKNTCRRVFWLTGDRIGI